MTDHRLLDIQRLDTEAEQLRHRHATLPERDALADAQAERSRLEALIATLAASRLEVATRQKRFEDEAQIFATKADEDDKRLYSGEVGMKDLQPLQDEIAGLRDRQGELEDRALEAMEEAESLAGEQAASEAALQETGDRITALEAELAASEAEVDGLLTDVTAARAEARAEVGDADLAEYERLRPGLGSSTVVRFDGGNCVGCPSTMPAVELDRMKHAESGAVLNCSECGRIVIT
jgi:predicted  nucleic acid-binding Zn-ribbon protein